MSEQPSDPQLVTLEPVTVAVVRETVPMGSLTEFFGRAFNAVATATKDQGVVITGPPIGVYYRIPTDTVDVAAGFPTDRPVIPGDSVMCDTLPGGRAAQVVHVGTYDSMDQTYGRLMEWLGTQGLTASSVMWESYLTEPGPDSPMEKMQTLITWPLVS